MWDPTLELAAPRSGIGVNELSAAEPGHAILIATNKSYWQKCAEEGQDAVIHDKLKHLPRNPWLAQTAA